MGVTHTSPGSAFSSLSLPLALRLQIQRHRGLSALQRTALESRARRNNRLVPLGGSRVHACRSPRPTRPPARPPSRAALQPLRALLPLLSAGAAGKDRPGKGAAHLEAGHLVTHSTLAGSSFWVGSPKGLTISHFQSALFSICHFPTATGRPAGPSQPPGVSVPLIGR